MKTKLIAGGFSTNNDTDKYAVVIDDYYQLFNTKEEALVFYTYAHRGEKYIEEMPFGSMHIIPPNYQYLTISGEGSDEYLSNYDPIDLKDYVDKSWQRIKNVSFKNEERRQEYLREKLMLSLSNKVFSKIDPEKAAKIREATYKQWFKDAKLI